MMIDNGGWLDQQLGAQIRESARQEAENYRRAPRTPLSIRRAQAWTGRRMVKIGLRLLIDSREWESRSDAGYNVSNALTG